MKKTLTALLAALVLVAGALAATAIAGGAATAQTSDDETDVVHPPDFPERGQILDEVLSDLVAENVITQAQADAIAEALVARHEELREEMQQWREENPGYGRFGRGFRRGFDLGTLLEDGVIDESELAELPDDHPLKNWDGPEAEDGFTLEELREIHEQLREQHRAERQAEGTGA